MITDYTNAFPQSTLTKISIPKEKFYQTSGANQKIKRLFIDEVEKITLKAVLAPRTMNIANDTYDEMHIIEVHLKGDGISFKILETIDSVIPRPILFAIVRPNGDAMYAISYKEPKAMDASKSKIVHYYTTSWGVEPLAIKGGSVKTIYINFIRQIDPTFDTSKSIVEAVQDTKQREKIQKQIDAINRQITREPSIARKQELARRRFDLEQELYQ